MLGCLVDVLVACSDFCKGFFESKDLLTSGFLVTEARGEGLGEGLEEGLGDALGEG